MRIGDEPGSLHEALRATHRALASLLLAGAMLAPVVEAAAGWPAHTPLGVSLGLHVAILTTLGLAAAGATVRARVPRDRTWLRWLLLPPFAVGLAAIIHARANAFYTESALIEGMAVLFTLRIGAAVLRRRAVSRLDLAAAARRPTPFGWRGGAEWRYRLGLRSRPSSAGVRFADALTLLVGWLLLAAWTLIALAHRHPTGPLLLLVGALELVTLLALVPDALSEIGPFAERRAHGDELAGAVRAPTLVRYDAPRPPRRTFPMFRRHS